MLCSARFFDLLTKITCAKKFNLAILPRNLPVVVTINLIILDLCLPFSVLLSRSFITCLTHQSHYSYQAKPWSVYLEVEYFCSLAYYSVVCCNLDPWAQGQALRVFLSQKSVLTLFCQKYTFDLD